MPFNTLADRDEPVALVNLDGLVVAETGKSCLVAATMMSTVAC
jgi:hypothetical protein